MTHFQSILVPTNFSEIAANAYDYALQLAGSLGAKVNLLYCIPPTGATIEEAGFSARLHDDLYENAQQEMNEFRQVGLDRAMERGQTGTEVQQHVETGDLRYAVEELAREHQCDLIVMGTHGAGDRWDELFGTNASALVNRVQLPILIVPENLTYRPLNAVCYATDLKGSDAFKAGHLLAAFHPFKPRLDFIHVQTKPNAKTDYSLDLLRELFEGADYGINANYTRTIDENPVAGLFRHAEEAKCDLIIMARSGKSWWDRTFKRSHTRQAAMKANTPLLIYEASLVE